MCCWRFIPYIPYVPSKLLIIHGQHSATPCCRWSACDSAVIAANLMPKAGEANLTSKTCLSVCRKKKIWLIWLPLLVMAMASTIYGSNLGTQTMRWLMCAQNGKPICETLMRCSMACGLVLKPGSLTQNKWSHILKRIVFGQVEVSNSWGVPSGNLT